MKTKNAVFAAILVVVLVVAAFAVYFTQVHPAENSSLPAGEPPQWQINLTGNVDQEKTLTINDLTQMPLTNVTTVINGENATYVGVPFYDFCNLTGMQWDVGPIEVISADGTIGTMNIFQAYNSSAYPYYYTNNVITLVFVKNGQWMTEETGGPVKLVAPYFSAEYQVDSVAEIRFKPWLMYITGEVENPLVITRANLTSYPSTTVYAEFAPSVKRWANWTGLPILDVLELANMTARAEKITVVAVDGYVKNYTLTQVADGNMLIGYAENDQPLPHTDGGPYRLFAPTDQYKWAQFWVKFVSEIIVS
ncbi:MAG: molybdopterin-dependent oxidoreductase [Candidatus Bathyarchaeota archaeon]|nr:molybdopterin-dependent oxidoreductase [Candidatus Bathyarchaeota archaeon]